MTKDFGVEDIPAFVSNCSSAKIVLLLVEYLMIAMAFYFFILSFSILVVPLIKGYSSILQTMAKNQLYFDLLPNLLVMTVFILRRLSSYNSTIADL